MEIIYQNLTKYDHIIFDWNGTLLSDVDLVLDILNENSQIHQASTMTYDDYRNRFSFPIRDFYSTLGIDEDRFDVYQAKYHELYDSKYKHTQLYAGTMELIQSLHGEGKTLSILSAAEQGHLHEAVEHFGIKPYLHHVYGVSNKFAKDKQHRGAELMKAVGMDPAKTVLVGDTLYDAEVAKFLNIDILLVADGHQSYERLLASGHPTIPSRFA